MSETLGLSPHARAERNAEILRMAERHVPPLAIAKHVKGATVQIVHNVLFQARHSGLKPATRRGRYKPRGHGIILPGDIVKALQPAAVARGCSVADIAKDILIAVAEGGIVEAVLDDGVKSE